MAHITGRTCESRGRLIQCSERGTRRFSRKIAQPLPVSREVSGQKEYQQNLDGLHRLERPQIHFRIIAARPRSKSKQRDEQQKSGEQRRVAPLGRIADS